MFAPATRKTVVIFSAAALLSAGGAAVWFSDLTPIARGNPESLLSLLRDRSPGQRPVGAQSAKRGPMSAMLSDNSPAAKLLPARAPAVRPAMALSSVAGVPPMSGVIAPMSGVAAPLPFAAAGPLFAAPAFGPAATGGAMIFPPILTTGGGGITSAAVTVPGAGPSPVPGVPEPGTWAMMIVGFGLIGGVLRRRRRLTVAMTTRAQRPVDSGPMSLASARAL